MPMDRQSVPQFSGNPRGQHNAGSGILVRRKRLLRPRRQALQLTYSEGGRIAFNTSESANEFATPKSKCSEQREPNKHTYRVFKFLTSSISSALSYANVAIGNVLGLLSKESAAYSKEFQGVSPAKAGGSSPPKLVISISRDEDMSMDDASTSIMSLSGASSYGTRKASNMARFWNVTFFIVAGLLAFAHIVILPNDIPSTNLAVPEALANEVPANTIVPAIQAPIVSKNQPIPFVRDTPQSAFGSRKLGQRERWPLETTRDCVSIVAKSRAELRLAKIHAEAMEGANARDLMHAESVEIQTKQFINVDTDERKSRPSFWKLLGSSFVPALVKAAGQN